MKFDLIPLRSNCLALQYTCILFNSTFRIILQNLIGIHQAILTGKYAEVVISAN